MMEARFGSQGPALWAAAVARARGLGRRRQDGFKWSFGGKDARSFQHKWESVASKQNNQH
jgi:hypothetical protein